MKELQALLEKLEKFQETMGIVNNYYLQHKTLDGCSCLPAEEIEQLTADMTQESRAESRPYENYILANNLAAISQVKTRLQELVCLTEPVYVEWEFHGGCAKTDQTSEQLQVFFDSQPSQEICAELRRVGFQWTTDVGAWQQQISASVFQMVDRLECLRPIFGGLPSHLHRWAVQEHIRRTAAVPVEAWRAIQYDLSAGERITVEFCKLTRMRFPGLLMDGPAQAAQARELARMFRADPKAAANQMTLTVAGYVVGAEMPREIEQQAEALMARLTKYKALLQEGKANSRPHRKLQER